MTVEIDTAISGTVVVLPPDLALVRETYGRWRFATITFAEACQAATANGRTQREIADAAGCSQPMVSYAIQAYKIATDNNVIKGDLEPDDFDRAMKAVRKPRPGLQVRAKPSSVEPRPWSLLSMTEEEMDLAYGPELPNYVAPRPIRDYSTEDALADNLASLERLLRFTVQLDLTPHQRADFRSSALDLLEEMGPSVTPSLPAAFDTATRAMIALEQAVETAKVVPAGSTRAGLMRQLGDITRRAQHVGSSLRLLPVRAAND